MVSQSIFAKDFTQQELESLQNKVDTLENIFLDLLREIQTMKEQSKECEVEVMEFALKFEKIIKESGITNGVGDFDDEGNQVTN